MRFRKKPIVIEAVKYAGNGNVEPRGAVPPWMHNAFADGTLRSTNGNDPLVVRTLEGDMTVAIGDWIIRGVKGEIYPCKPDIFSATYHPVEASDKIDLTDAVREAIVASREYDPDFSTLEQIQMLRESFRESQLAVRRLSEQLTATNSRLAKVREFQPDLSKASSALRFIANEPDFVPSPAGIDELRRISENLAEMEAALTEGEG